MKIGSTPIKGDNKFQIDFDFMEKAGFQTVDIQIFSWLDSPIYSMNEEEFVMYFEELKSNLKKHNLIPQQLHSLWNYNRCDMDEEKKWDNTINYYIKSFKGAQILGCKYVVLHHRFPFGYEENENTKKYGYDLNVRFIKKLLPYASKYGVTICIENLPFYIEYSNVNSTLKMIKEINSPNVKMCLDTGHYNCVDKSVDIYTTILNIGENLKVLHVHDNDGSGDQHLLPGKGSINWDDFFKALKDIKFDGSISFETESGNKDKSEKLKDEIALINFAKNHYQNLNN